MDIMYRPYKEADTEELLSLMAELGYSIPQEDFWRTIREIHKRDGAIFVAEVANKVIGSVSLLIDVRLAEGVSGEIASLIVSEKFRGLGIGKKLIQLAEKHLSKHVGIIRIRANVKREAAHDYYKALGYEEIKDQKVFIKPLQ
jgi:ribosomal protein S18 acetylase RimI-like enzyme